jgi:hypothetical protein
MPGICEGVKEGMRKANTMEKITTITVSIADILMLGLPS